MSLAKESLPEATFGRWFLAFLLFFNRHQTIRWWILEKHVLPSMFSFFFFKMRRPFLDVLGVLTPLRPTNEFLAWGRLVHHDRKMKDKWAWGKLNGANPYIIVRVRMRRSTCLTIQPSVLLPFFLSGLVPWFFHALGIQIPSKKVGTAGVFEKVKYLLRR